MTEQSECRRQEVTAVNVLYMTCEFLCQIWHYSLFYIFIVDLTIRPCFVVYMELVEDVLHTSFLVTCKIYIIFYGYKR